MTPIDILEEVKERFPVLLHDEETKLLALLHKAVWRYQDYAGFKAQKRLNDHETLIDLPNDYLALITVTDSTGGYVKATEWRDDGKLELKLRGREKFPLIFTYMKKVTKEDMASFDIPSTAAGLISDYLEALIDIPNNARRRTIAIAGKLDASDITSEDVLNARKVELEEKITASRAIIPCISVRG